MYLILLLLFVVPIGWDKCQAQIDKDSIRQRLYEQESVKERIVKAVAMKLGYNLWVSTGYVLDGRFSSQIFLDKLNFLPAFDSYPKITIHRFFFGAPNDSLLLYRYQWDDLGTIDRIFEEDIVSRWEWRQNKEDVDLYESGAVMVDVKSKAIFFIGGVFAEDQVPDALLRNIDSSEDWIKFVKYKFMHLLPEDVSIEDINGKVKGRFYSQFLKGTVQCLFANNRMICDYAPEFTPTKILDYVGENENQRYTGLAGCVSAETIVQSIGRNAALYYWSALIENPDCTASLNGSISRQNIVSELPGYLQEFTTRIRVVDTVKKINGMVAYGYESSPLFTRRLAAKMLLEPEEAVIEYGPSGDVWTEWQDGGYCYVDTVSGEILYASGRLFTHDLREHYFVDSLNVNGMYQYLKDRLFNHGDDVRIELDKDNYRFRLIQSSRYLVDTVFIQTSQLYSLNYNVLSSVLDRNNCRLQFRASKSDLD